MREIKFRAWDKHRKEYLSAGQVLLAILPGARPEHNPIYLDVLKCADVYRERFVLEQFSGMRDKNGEEIYEGDICLDKDSVVKIVWSENHQWGCKIVKTKYILQKDLIFPLWQWDRCEINGNRELEVIGNIHENPGLLEKQPCG